MKSEQQENYKRQSELLEQFANAETDTMQKISEMMESLSTSVRNRMSNPDIVNHKYSFSIESPYMFEGFRGIFALIVVLAVALYIAKQPDYDRIDNDLKYRYIKMKGEASPK